ncbi:YeeE/YedE family protein (plasmid) [Deinococcus metallilatus]|uniref:YeeE/YedE family protein n=1 Tax=Deinococcus metallilatus TaxID=1211322 RepID=A0AAJ5F7C7_9DEIO|nr:YeeE/YedE family protein [Deinococcus metallilatus]RXJ14927.1 YeeE/YedE family protein [Deinococcus metallilatus]TLK31047.1 YeeE/YedE family protein [Deinococcus metallilatus]
MPGVHAEPSSSARTATGLLAYLLVGLSFGIVLVKSEAASWYRIQEMFRFESFHMFGLIGSAVLTGLVTTAMLRRSGVKSRDGQTIRVTDKEKGWRRYVFGGLTFGVGWGLAGVCPGPIFTLLGAGVWPMLVVLLFALLGTWAYGALQTRLPH